MDSRVHELLDNMAFENPRPEEKWFSEDGFDPPFTRGALKAAHRAGRIELNMGGDVWQFRFTPKGRDDYEAAEAFVCCEMMRA